MKTFQHLHCSSCLTSEGKRKTFSIHWRKLAKITIPLSSIFPGNSSQLACENKYYAHPRCLVMRLSARRFMHSNVRLRSEINRSSSVLSMVVGVLNLLCGTCASHFLKKADVKVVIVLKQSFQRIYFQKATQHPNHSLILRLRMMQTIKMQTF